MKKSVLIALVLSTSAFADEAFIFDHMFRPCNFYSYSTEARGYICSSPGMTIRVPYASDTQRVISALEAKIEQLEARVKKLETPAGQ